MTALEGSRDAADMLSTHRKQFARTLRMDQTQAELLLWRTLRGRRFQGYKFRRQRPIGPYIADFACLERRVIVEVDGAQHLAQADYDHVRDESLRGARFRVLRFTNHEVLREIEGVTAAILQALESAPPER